MVSATLKYGVMFFRISGEVFFSFRIKVFKECERGIPVPVGAQGARLTVP